VINKTIINEIGNLSSISKEEENRKLIIRNREIRNIDLEEIQI